jgi:hypothetical protein
VSSYYYRGRRYTRPSPLKRAVTRIAHRVWESMQGCHPPGGGGREPEHYVAQAMRQTAKALEANAMKTAQDQPEPQKEEV